jgi:predicted ArsR family transcriptional regulator
MGDDFADRVAGIGALAEPARRALYRYVVSQPDAVSRERAADGVGIAVHSAKFHLDRLVEEGLLDVEYRRLSGRTGPGAGRPAKLYRRSAREVSVSLPERRYDLAGQILARAVERAAQQSADVSAAVQAVAAEHGRAAGAEAPRDDVPEQDVPGEDVPELDRLADALTPYGYEPRLREDVLVLANCPFDALAREHTQLICGMNEAFVGGVLDGLGCRSTEACLDPEPGLCCVKARPR